MYLHLRELSVEFYCPLLLLEFSATPCPPECWVDEIIR